MPNVKMRKAPSSVQKINKRAKGKLYYLEQDDKKDIFLGTKLTLRKIQDALVRISKSGRRIINN
jgi:hypothetical protein